MYYSEKYSFMVNSRNKICLLVSRNNIYKYKHNFMVNWLIGIVYAIV